MGIKYKYISICLSTQRRGQYLTRYALLIRSRFTAWLSSCYEGGGGSFPDPNRMYFCVVWNETLSLYKYIYIIYKEMNLKLSSAKQRPFYVDLAVLTCVLMVICHRQTQCSTLNYSLRGQSPISTMVIEILFGIPEMHLSPEKMPQTPSFVTPCNTRS